MPLTLSTFLTLHVPILPVADNAPSVSEIPKDDTKPSYNNVGLHGSIISEPVSLPNSGRP